MGKTVSDAELSIISPIVAARAKPLKEFYSRKEAAIYLTAIGYKITAKTLTNLASNNNEGKGPPFDRLGWGSVRYGRSDLDAWAKARTVRVA